MIFLNNSCRKSLAGLAACVGLAIGIASGNTLADDSRRGKNIKNAEILATILETSSNNTQGRPRARVEGLYLERQGFMFSIELSGSFFGGNFDFHFGSIEPFVDRIMSIQDHSDNEFILWEGDGDIELAHTLPMPPMPPLPPMPEHRSFNVFMGESDIENIEWKNELKKFTDSVKKMVEEQKEKYAEMRKLQAQYQNTKAGSEAREVALQAMESVREKLRLAKQRTLAEMEKMRVEREKLDAEQMASLVDDLVDTLCNYSGSLRSLAKDEHVSLVIEGGAKGSDRDQVYIFSKPVIDECGSKDISTQKVLAKVITYPS